MAGTRDIFLEIANSIKYLSKRVRKLETLVIRRGYIEYVALLTQAGVAAPSVVEIKNDTGATMTWSYTAVGTYLGTLSSPVLTENRTVILVSNPQHTVEVRGVYVSTSIVTILSGNTSTTLSDSLLSGAAIIIRVYI